MTRDTLKYKVRTVRGNAEWHDTMSYRELREAVTSLMATEGVRDFGSYAFSDSVFIEWEVTAK